MELYNCYSKKEIALKEKDLSSMSISEMKELVNEIYRDWQDGKFEDEFIVIDAYYQIALAMSKKQEEG